MKKILILISLLALVGCQSKYEDSLAKPKKAVSTFDGTTTYSSKISPSWSDGSWSSAGVGFNGFAKQGQKGYMVAEVTFINSVANLKTLYLNIDGVISEHEALDSLSKVSYGPSTRIPMSSRGFMMPVSTVDKINSAKSVTFRVTTLSDGSREGQLVRDGKLSAAAKSLINVAEQVK
jgi:hypothetical protein